MADINPQDRIPVAPYAKVSTNRKVVSIQDQLEQTRKYAQANNMDTVAEYVDVNGRREASETTPEE